MGAAESKEGVDARLGGHDGGRGWEGAGTDGRHGRLGWTPIFIGVTVVVWQCGEPGWGWPRFARQDEG